MSLINTSDLYSRIYEEIVTEISREDTAIAERAITAAIQEAKMYLAKFDLVALFGTDAPALDNSDDSSIAPTVNDVFLKNLLVDIAVWNLVKLGNPNIQYEPTLKTYEMAIKTLERILKGNLQPEGWPYKDTTNETAAPGDAITYSSNAKRTQHF